eukprot:2259878-Amphidinium_carterae.1
MAFSTPTTPFWLHLSQYMIYVDSLASRVREKSINSLCSNFFRVDLAYRAVQLCLAGSRTDVCIEFVPIVGALFGGSVFHVLFCSTGKIC